MFDILKHQDKLSKVYTFTPNKNKSNKKIKDINNSYNFSYLNPNEKKNENEIFSRLNNFNNYEINNSNKYAKPSKSKSNSNSKSKSRNKFENLSLRRSRSKAKNTNNSLRKIKENSKTNQMRKINKEKISRKSEEKDKSFEKLSKLLVQNSLNDEKNSNNSRSEYNFDYDATKEYFKSSEFKYPRMNFEERLNYHNEKSKEKKILLANQIYSENGITFNPKISNNKNHKINSNFLERIKDFSHRKQENLEKLKISKIEKENETIKKPRSLSKDEYEKTYKGIVERLYKTEIDKIKELQKLKIEEEKLLEKEMKQKRKSNKEIETHNKQIIERLYINELDKILEKAEMAKVIPRKQVIEDLEEKELKNLEKIKELNKESYTHVSKKLNTNLENAKKLVKLQKEKENLIKKIKRNSKSKNYSSEKKEQLNDKLKEKEVYMKKLQLEHKIKFKKREIEDRFKEEQNKSKSKSKSKERSRSIRKISNISLFTPEKNTSYQEIKEVEEKIENNESPFIKKEKRTNFRKSESKIIKPIIAKGGHQKRNSDLLLEMNNKHNHKKSLSNSSKDFSNPFSSGKKNSIVRENSNSSSKNYLAEKKSIPRKSLKDELNKVINTDISGIIKDDNNKTTYSKSLHLNNTNFSNNTISKNTEENLLENDNINNLSTVKENKFKSKGLERILNINRK
jgi:hypothetical protein